MTSKIYIVQGSTGEWSDRGEWLVRAFLTEEKAKEHVAALEKKYKEFGREQCGFQRGAKQRKKLEEAMEQLDPRFNEDYTGTNWWYEEVDLDETT